jgi:hypothetical protein
MMVFSLLANVIANVVTMQVLIKLNLLKEYSKVAISSALCSMVATLILPYFLGLNGAAIAWLIAEYSLLFYSIRQLKRSGSCVIDWRSFHPRNIMNYWMEKRLTL